LAPALIKAFEATKDDDPRVRRYLALAIGRLDPPLPPSAIATLVKSLEDPDRHWNADWVSRLNGWSDAEINEARISTIWALGSSGDPGVVAHLEPLYNSADAGVRKIVVYALGALPGDTQLVTLRTALEDSTVDVRWNAAIALARHGRSDGVPVLRQMLDRAYVERVVKRTVREDLDQDPIADVMISSLRAVASLKDPTLKGSVATLSQQDRSLKVRQAALEALKMIG
jgi:HEAT repeat protein